jgi:2-polyprenyl-3-methyl-5-hydroxy-6-metoxy-1,4-benzoquinol methylase
MALVFLNAIRSFAELCLYLLFGIILPRNVAGLSPPSRRSLVERWKHIKWLLWYRYFHHLTRPLEIAFMNWGYRSSTNSTELSLEESAVLAPLLPQDADQRVIELESLSLYNNLARGPNVTLAKKRVLEVSCGKGGGLTALTLLHRPATACGLDMCVESVQLCNTRFSSLAPNLAFSVGDALGRLPPCDVLLNVEASHCYANRSLFFSNCTKSLSSGGVLLMADFFSTENLAAARTDLTASCGFVLERDEDITNEVLAAMEHTHGAKQRLIATLGPRWVAWALRRFASTKDSMPYIKLKSGVWRYHLFQARKP